MAGNPTRHKGSAAFLSLGLTEADQVNLSGIARGLDNINVDEQEQTRPVPGGGVTRTVQALGYRKGNANLSIDENVYTGPLFHGKNGRRMYAVYGPEGNGVGSPKLTFEAICEVAHNIESAGVRRFSVTLRVDGVVTRGVFS